MKAVSTICAIVFALGSASAALAQAPKKAKDVPADHRPPPGMCRIWVDGVPAGQQPAPTDCATAVRNRPEHGRVIFGSDAAPDARTVQPRSFTETLRKPGQTATPQRGPDPRRPDSTQGARRREETGPPGKPPERAPAPAPRSREQNPTKPDGR